MRTRTTRETDAVVVPPFIAELRGGGSDAHAVTDALPTVTASGDHHMLVTSAATMAAWAAVYAYDSGRLLDHLDVPLPTQTTVVGDALVTGGAFPAVEDCLLRPLEPHEIARGMAFAADYRVTGTKRQRVRATATPSPHPPLKF